MFASTQTAIKNRVKISVEQLINDNLTESIANENTHQITSFKYSAF